jgi:hypothetical protein
VTGVVAGPDDEADGLPEQAVNASMAATAT